LPGSPPPKTIKEKLQEKKEKKEKKKREKKGKRDKGDQVWSQLDNTTQHHSLFIPNAY
jgi:hypothetical protein